MKRLPIILVLILLPLYGCAGGRAAGGAFQSGELVHAGSAVSGTGGGPDVLGTVGTARSGDDGVVGGGSDVDRHADEDGGLASDNRGDDEHRCPDCGKPCREHVGPGPACLHTRCGCVLAARETQEKERRMSTATLAEFSIDGFLGNIGWLALAFTVGAIFGPMIIKWMKAGFKKVTGKS